MQGVTDELLSFQADHVWIEENREDLLRSYPDQWIAVKDRKLVATAPDLDGLLARLPDPGHTTVELITREPLEMVL